jgi:hypothetical protein
VLPDGLVLAELTGAMRVAARRARRGEEELASVRLGPDVGRGGGVLRARNELGIIGGCPRWGRTSGAKMLEARQMQDNRVRGLEMVARCRTGSASTVFSKVISSFS